MSAWLQLLDGLDKFGRVTAIDLYATPRSIGYGRGFSSGKTRLPLGVDLIAERWYIQIGHSGERNIAYDIWLCTQHAMRIFQAKATKGVEMECYCNHQAGLYAALDSVLMAMVGPL